MLPMKTLVIPEKPSVGRDIAAALGGGFSKERKYDIEYLERDDIIIAPARGHLVGLQCPAEHDPGYNLARLPAIPPQFALEPNKGELPRLNLLGRLIARTDVDAVVNACDAGREGELIFRYIAMYHQCSKPMFRMWLQSMTPGAIMTAFTDMEPAHLRDNLAAAAQCRSESDWLIGINGTRAVEVLSEMQTGRRTKTTVGRVQTPVLYLVVERELAIKNFVAKDYFEVQAEFAAGQQRYTAKWLNPEFRPDPQFPDAKADRFFDRQQAEAIASKCRGHQPSSVTDQSTEISTPAPKLFDLTTLQREANTKFGFSASDTLKLAQNLYQTHKVLTYPRTDANALPEDYVQTAQLTLGRIGQSQHALAPHAEAAIPSVRPDKRIFNNAKISDHFAIIPTGLVSQSLNPEEAKLYDLVLRRFIAVFYPPAIHLQTVRTTIVNRETFHSSGRVLASPGWKVIYDVAEEEDAKEDAPPLCLLAPGQVLPNTKMNVAALQTRKPARFTEASLLGAMESAGAVIEDEDLRDAMKGRGLGTPATRAPTIEHLLHPDVAYMTRQKKQLLPTQKAFDLIEFLRNNGLMALTAAQTTGEWEYKLLQMEEGKFTREAFMQGIYQMTHNIVDRVKACAATLTPAQQAINAPPTLSTILCPCCHNALNSDANTLTCQCGFKLWKTILGIRLTEDQCETLLGTGAHPPISGFKSPKKPRPFSAGLKLADDLSGKVEFVFEDRAPASAALGGSNDQEPAPEHLCPVCQKPLRQRTSAKGKFWGCSGYPTCKKTLPDKNGRPQA